MLHAIKTHFVGPAKEFDFRPAKRLTILTGNNSLGKSLLLDLAFWACTGAWPFNEPVIPQHGQFKSAKIDIIKGNSNEENSALTSETCNFDAHFNIWRPANRLMVSPIAIYFDINSGVSLFDSKRIVVGKDFLGETFLSGRPHEARDPLIFDKYKIWEGLSKKGVLYCEGITKDLLKWQVRRKEVFEIFTKIFKILSGDESNLFKSGGVTFSDDPIRLPGSDVQDWPALKMPYGIIPIKHASEAIKRILSLAYMLVWSWEEHKRAAEVNGTQRAKSLLMLIDEPEAHLHPQWQRLIAPALMQAVKALDSELDLQLIIATHSPLVLAGLEGEFDPEKDRLYHLEQTEKGVVLEEKPFPDARSVNNWLTSDIFGLGEARSLKAQQAIEAAEAVMADNRRLSGDEKEKIEHDLREAISSIDPFWTRWRLSQGEIRIGGE